MRCPSIMFLTLLTSACGGQSANENRIEAQIGLQDQIAADDPKACAAVDAIRTALNAANQEYGQALSNGMTEIRVDTVSATGINKDIHEISCSATGYAKFPFVDGEGSFPIIYKLRPSLDQGGGFVAEIAANPLVRQMVANHILWWKRQNIPNQAGEQSVGNGPVSMADASIRPDGVKETDICRATVLHQVASIEDPSSKMEPGEAYNDVTQFIRNKKTGETRFCQHGGYCYPSHVTLNQQKVEAIRLNNCSVGRRDSDDGEDIYYWIAINPPKKGPLG